MKTKHIGSTPSPMQAEFTVFDFEATVNSAQKRDITVYFINGRFDQLLHMKSGKLDFLSRILCVILDILSFYLLWC